jgi:hypothetical protein
MARYKLSENGVYDNVNNYYIPANPSNRHWQEYQAWLAEGNTPDPLYTLDELKEMKLNEVKQKFKEALANGSFYSKVLEAEVNKGPEHLRNVESIIEYMIATGETETDFRLYDNSFKRVTLNQLQALKIEMIGLGNEYYQRKWQLEEQIKNAKTEEELNSIVISF